MQQEAGGLGAHGVIGVRLTSDAREWGQNLLEFKAIGTAVRLTDSKPQDCRSSRTSRARSSGCRCPGHWPVGLALGYCTYYTAASWGTSWATMSWNNQELTQYTEGVYRARHLAMSRMSDMGPQMGAAGIVGVHITQEHHEVEQDSGGGQHQKGLMAHFAAIGTAISPEREAWKVPSPSMVYHYNEAAIEAEELQMHE